MDLLSRGIPDSQHVKLSPMSMRSIFMMYVCSHSNQNWRPTLWAYILIIQVNLQYPGIYPPTQTRCWTEHSSEFEVCAHDVVYNRWLSDKNLRGVKRGLDKSDVFIGVHVHDTGLEPRLNRVAGLIYKTYIGLSLRKYPKMVPKSASQSSDFLVMRTSKLLYFKNSSQLWVLIQR